jgi:sugar lactone lactonase YvrE
VKSFWTIIPCCALILVGCPGTPTVSTRVQGAPLHGANGVRFDSQGRLNVASVFSREIVVMDPRRGTILGRYGAEDGVETPDDLVFGPDGSLYWTAIATGQVGRISPDGTFKVIAQLPPGVNPITFSPEGRLFVGLCFLGAGLFEIDPEGVKPPRSIREFPGDRCGVNAFDIGPDGRLYAPRFFSPDIVSIDVDSGEMETVATGFTTPVAAKFDRFGRLNVLDAGSGQLVQLDLETGARDVLAKVPLNSDNIAFDARGRLFFSVNDTGAIHQVLRDGRTREVSPGGLTFPGGIAVVGSSLYVADHYSLVEFDADSGLQRSRETSLIGVSELSEPMTVSASDGTLVLSSWLANSVQVWDPATRHAVQTYTDFNVPLNAIAFGGGLAVAQLGAANVVLEKDGVRTPLLEGLAVPTGLVADATTLYVADWALGTITRVTPQGTTVVASDLVNPEGLALDLDHTLLVVEAGAGRVTQVNPDSGEKQILVENLVLGLPGVPGFAPSHAFNGIAVGPSGAIFVTGDTQNAVYAIERPAQLWH